MPDTKQFPPLTDHQIAHTMKKYGGGFVRAIAEAWFQGDDTNRPRVRAAFPEYFEKYAAMTVRCPECGGTDIGRGHHDGTTCGVPECDYKICETCGHKFDMN